MKERKEEEKLKKKEELKRLKNLKREELSRKLEQIRSMAGGDLMGLDELDLEEEFDPDQHDSKMDAVFSGEYYDVQVCLLYGSVSILYRYLHYFRKVDPQRKSKSPNSTMILTSLILLVQRKKQRNLLKRRKVRRARKTNTMVF